MKGSCERSISTPTTLKLLTKILNTLTDSLFGYVWRIYKGKPHTSQRFPFPERNWHGGFIVKSLQIDNETVIAFSTHRNAVIPRKQMNTSILDLFYLRERRQDIFSVIKTTRWISSWSSNQSKSTVPWGLHISSCTKSWRKTAPVYGDQACWFPPQKS